MTSCRYNRGSIDWVERRACWVKKYVAEGDSWQDRRRILFCVLDTSTINARTCRHTNVHRHSGLCTKKKQSILRATKKVNTWHYWRIDLKKTLMHWKHIKNINRKVTVNSIFFNITTSFKRENYSLLVWLTDGVSRHFSCDQTWKWHSWY